MPEPIVYVAEEGAMEVEYSSNGTPEIAPSTPPAPAPAPAAAEPAPAAAPAAEPMPATPAEPAGTGGEPATPPAPAPSGALYKYGDRELSADAFYDEVMGNLLPDYTRKSQELAKLGGAGKTPAEINNTPPETPPVEELGYWEKPDWVPANAGEIVKATADMQARDAARSAGAEAARIAEIQTETETVLASLKKADPALNEELLFQHANKYKFTDLTAAYINLTDTLRIANEQRLAGAATVTRKNDDPIAGKTNITADDDGYDPSVIDPQESAVDYFRRTKQR